MVQVFIDWSEKELEKYDTHYLEILLEVFKSGFPSKKQDMILSHYIYVQTLEAFLWEKSLVPREMQYCPCCNECYQASKKFGVACFKLSNHDLESWPLLALILTPSSIFQNLDSSERPNTYYGSNAAKDSVMLRKVMTMESCKHQQQLCQ